MTALNIEPHLKSKCLLYSEKQLSRFFSPSRLTLSALGIKLNEYWTMVTEKQAKKQAFNAVDGQQEEEKNFNDE